MTIWASCLSDVITGLQTKPNPNKLPHRFTKKQFPYTKLQDNQAAGDNAKDKHEIFCWILKFSTQWQTKLIGTIYEEEKMKSHWQTKTFTSIQEENFEENVENRIMHLINTCFFYSLHMHSNRPTTHFISGYVLISYRDILGENFIDF